MSRVVRVESSESERIRELLVMSLRADGWSPRGALELLGRIIEQELWRELGFADLGQMLRSPRPRGVGMTDDEMWRLREFRHPHENDVLEVREHMDRVRVELSRCAAPRSALNGELGNGRPSSPDIIRATHHGTSARDTLRRLRRDRPDLADRVDHGRLSAHQAAILAGFRKPTATVPIDSPKRAMQALSRRFSRDELQEALDELGSGP